MNGLLIAFATTLLAAKAFAASPLLSWNDTASKQAIVKFVNKLTNQGSPHFVPQEERIATFDNDGALWSEQPMYFQFFFVMDRVKALAPQHSEWNTKEPYASVLKGDMNGALAARGSASMCSTPMANANGPTTANPTPARSTRDSMRRTRGAGRSST